MSRKVLASFCYILGYGLLACWLFTKLTFLSYLALVVFSVGIGVYVSKFCAVEVKIEEESEARK